MITEWNDLPMGQYLDILKVASDDNTTDLEKQVAYIAILSGKTEEEILALPIMEYSEYAEGMQFLLQPATEYKGKMTDRITIGKNKYRLTTDYRTISTAQYIDFHAFAQSATDHIVELISVFLVPEGMSYNSGYDVMDVQKDIRQGLSVPIANAMIAFFLTRLRISIKATLISLVWMSRWIKTRRKMLKRVMAQVQTALTPDGTGLHR